MANETRTDYWYIGITYISEHHTWEGDYTFNVSIDSQDDAGSGGDVGGSWDDAYEIGEDVYEGQIRDLDTEDMYKIELEPSSIIEIKFESEADGGQELTFYAPDDLNREKAFDLTSEGGLLSSDDFSLANETETDFWYIEITYQADHHDWHGEYTFEVSIDSQDDAGSGGDVASSFDDAFEIGEGEHEGQIRDLDTADMYKVWLYPNSLIEIDFESDAVEEQELTLYDDNRDEIFSLSASEDDPPQSDSHTVGDDVEPDYWFIEITYQADYHDWHGHYTFEVDIEVEETVEGTIIVDGEGSIIAERWDEDSEEWIEHPESPIEDEYTEEGPIGTQIRLTADPDPSWEFVEWTGDETGTDTTIEFTMDEDKEITAIFESEDYDEEGLADSPWPSFGRDQQNNRKSPYDTSYVDGTEKWSFETGDEVLSSPAVDEDGTIYVGSRDNNLYALNSDGTEKWSFETDGMVSSSPAIGADGTIYVGSFDNNLYAINPDGTEEWTFETGDTVFSSPTIADDGTVYVGSFDSNLYAINPDGTEEWSFETEDMIDSSPGIAADGTIYVGSWDNNLYAVNPDGTEEWSFETGGNVWSTPTIADDGTIYVSSWDENLYAVNPDGSEKWTFEIGWEPTANPAIGDDGTIYVGGGDENLYAINPDGSERWTFETGGFVQSAPAIGGDGTIYIGSANTFLHAVNQDGTEKWSFQTDGEVRSSSSIGEDGTVYIGSSDNNLYAITGEHTLTIEEPIGEGSIEVNDQEITSWPYQGDYEHGTEVDLEAIADSDWYFEEWTGDYTGEDNPTTITMDSEKDITAVFGTDLEIHEGTIIVDGEGSVIVEAYDEEEGEWDEHDDSPVDDELIDHAEHGTQIRLTAEPDPDWEFVEWTGDETGTDTTLEFTMDDDKEITAVFEVEDEIDGEYQDSITDEEDDVFYWRVTDDEWRWEENVERPDIDIVRASIEESGGVIFVEIEVKGTIQEDVEIWYGITLEDEDGNTYRTGYAQGQGYLEHPTGAFSIQPSGFGTDTLEISFSLQDIGNPTYLEIVEVETHDWIDAEEEGEYYYDTAGPEATEPDTEDEEDDEDEVDPEGVMDELLARGMMCLAAAIIIPIIVLIIIVVVVIKLLGSEDEGGQQQPPQQGPPPQEPPQQQQPQQQQPPAPPEDEGGSGEAPPPPENE